MKRIVLSAVILMVSIMCIEVPVVAQSNCNFYSFPTSERANALMEYDDFLKERKAAGDFFTNPLQLNGQALSYEIFGLKAIGELTLNAGGSFTGQLFQIPFYIYLKRDGVTIPLPGEETGKVKHLKVEISDILKLAQPGDQLIIEPYSQEYWQSKRIIKLLESGGC